MSIDYDLPPTESTPEQPAVGPVIDAPTSPAQARTERTPRAVNHTEGGLPAVPLLLITSNTAVAGLSAAAIAAGPVAAVGIMAGTAATAAAATVRARAKSRTTRRTTTTSAGRSGNRSGAATSTRRPDGTTTRTSTGLTGAGRGGTGSGGTPKARTMKSPGTAGSGRKGASPGGGIRTPGPVSQIKAIRKDKSAQPTTKKQSREQITAARRTVADARRAVKADRKNAKKLRKSPAGHGGVTGPAGGSTGHGPGNGTGQTTKLTKATKAAGAGGKKTLAARTSDAKTAVTAKSINGIRSAKDQVIASRRDRIRTARKAAKSRAVMARTIAGSHARYGAAVARSAVLAAPLTALGLITTPLGRKLGWKWLQAPGLRAYRALTARSKAAHLARVAAAKERHATNLNPPTDSDTTEPDTEQTPPAAPIADTVPRAPRTGAVPTLTEEEDPMDIHSEFTEASEQLVSAASAYEPGGMMHVRMTIRAMGPAIEQWANAFAVLAQKADDDFPLDPAVGEGLEGIHQALRAIVGDAEELALTFDRVHEHDINRIVQPRKGSEAEKTWDTTNNEDYDGE